MKHSKRSIIGIFLFCLLIIALFEPWRWFERPPPTYIAIDSLHPGKNIVLEEYTPKNSRKGSPLPVVLIPPMLGGASPVERMFARFFSNQGMVAIIVHRSKGNQNHGNDGSPELLKVNVALEYWTKELSRVIDWVEKKPELDSSRINVFGISMGGILGSLLVVTDQRVSKAVLTLAGGDIPLILSHSTELGIVEMRKQFLKEQNPERIQQFLDQYGETAYPRTPEELEIFLRKIVHWDPVRLAQTQPPDRKKVLMILAEFDETVPYRSGLKLREALGRPQKHNVKAQHYSAIFYIKTIQKMAGQFFLSESERSPDIPSSLITQSEQSQ